MITRLMNLLNIVVTC